MFVCFSIDDTHDKPELTLSMLEKDTRAAVEFKSPATPRKRSISASSVDSEMDGGGRKRSISGSSLDSDWGHSPTKKTKEQSNSKKVEKTPKRKIIESDSNSAIDRKKSKTVKHKEVDQSDSELGKKGNKKKEKLKKKAGKIEEEADVFSDIKVGTGYSILLK